MMCPRYSKTLLLLIACCLLSPPLRAQEDAEQETAQPEEEILGWTNSTEFSLVATYGNSETETLGLKNLLRHHWPKARYSLRIEGLRTRNADKKFIQVLPLPENTADINLENFIFIVEPKKELDVEKYLIETIYDRQLSQRAFWNVGFTWDRNKDANILNRYVAFGGLGNVWWDRDELHFNTSYGLSYTERHEETPDPEKNDEFLGLRFAWTFWKRWGKITTLGNNWTSNVSLSDAGDWNFDTTTWLTVAMNRRLALKVSLQWLFNGRPALREIEVLAILPEGVEIDFGNVGIRKEKLDTILNTSIVLNF